MLSKEDVLKKIYEAASILNRSIGKQGIFAGSGLRYQNQYWTRDVALALIPAFRSLQNIDKNLCGNASVSSDKIKTHLYNLAKKQGRSGAIPILFSDFPELVKNKMKKCSWDGTCLNVGSSFVLKRIFDGIHGELEKFPEFSDFPEDEQRGLYRLTPGTTDSELMFAFCMLNELGDCTAVRMAISYLEQNYVRDGLHHGADWRDTMEVFFRDKPLLTNNALLYAVYKKKGDIEKAEALKQAIDRTFWTGETYLDYPGSDRFDPLGASLAVLHGLVPPERYGAVLDGFKSVDTAYGVTIKCRHNAYQPGEAEVIEKTDGVVVWPFVVGFTVLAAMEIDQQFALDQFEKMHKHEGFGEYYDPADGSQWGEPERGWSAAMYVRAFEKVQHLIS